jgi:hypothetical protein
MIKIALSAGLIVGALAAPGAFAQTVQPSSPMPMQQSTPQSGMMTCPMMQRMTALDARIKQLEERAGIPTPATPPQAAGTPMAPH